MSKKKKLVLSFVMGIITTCILLPLLYAFGIPSFADILTALFGEGSILAIVFSLMLLLLIAFGLGKVTKRNV